MKSIIDCRLWLFDLDDTLVDWTERFTQARMTVAHEAVERFGTLDAGAWFRLFDTGHEVAWPRWETGEIDRAGYRRERFRYALEQQSLSDDRWIDDLSDRFLGMCRSYVKPDRRVHEMLTCLQPDHILAVLTNGFSDGQRTVLDRAGLLPFFPHIFISEETGYQKPDPRALTNVLTSLDIQPDDVVFIGDSWRRDIAPALSLGIHTVWINPNDDLPPDNQRPDLIVKHVSDLIDLLS